MNVGFKWDGGVEGYWDVSSMICRGEGNGGYKFEIKGMGEKRRRREGIEVF